MRVPVRVKYNTGVSSSEVNTQATSPSTQQEDKTVRVRLAEAIDGSLSQVSPHSSINSLIKVSVKIKANIVDINTTLESSKYLLRIVAIFINCN